MKKILSCLFVICLVCSLFLGCISISEHLQTLSTSSSPKKESGTIAATYIHNGIEREYILYIPEDLPENAPLVIGMHGYSSSAWTFKNRFGWDEVAQENKFIMCYPQGTIEVYNDYSHWNARLKLSTVDDVGFISNLALFLVDEYQLDKDRIFATGFSNGGYMSYTLACERPDVFRAIASVSGLMSDYTWQNYNPRHLTPPEWLGYYPSTPVPVCHIHGTEDSIVPIDGNTPYIIWSGGPSAPELIEFWAGINECTTIETKQITKNITATYYTNDETSAQVWYYVYEGWNHYWPSKDYTVDKPSEINAQDIIWEFFSMY